MPKLKLTYFDFHGGRGEPARLALSIGGIRSRTIASHLLIGRLASPTRRSAPCQCSKWMGRHSHSRMPSIAMWASSRISTRQTHGRLRCATRCWRQWRTSTPSLRPPFSFPKRKKTQRKALVEGPLPFYLARLQQRLEAHGGRYFAADRLSVADLKVFVWIRHLKSGVLDHVPADLPARVAPKLVEHSERVKNDPRVQAYYARHGVTG